MLLCGVRSGPVSGVLVSAQGGGVNEGAAVGGTDWASAGLSIQSSNGAWKSVSLTALVVRSSLRGVHGYSLDKPSSAVLDWTQDPAPLHALQDPRRLHNRDLTLT